MCLSSISNASSPLLRLPQELKDSIYRFVYAGSYIHVRYFVKGFYLASCNKPDHHPIHSRGCNSQLLSVASLRTCRQLYHERRSVFYFINTFEISEPRSGLAFLQDLGNAGLRLRSLHLHVSVDSKKDERDWRSSFHEVAKGLKNLKHLYIDVTERLWIQQNPAIGKKPFPRGLLELKKLPLETVEIVMSDRRVLNRNMYTEQFLWTMAQKQEWAESMKSAILGTS